MILKYPSWAGGEALISGREIMSMRLLIAEDNDDLRRTFVLAFERSGFEVRAACNGEEALSALNDRMPEVLILDIGMPGISGIDVMKSVREKEVERRIQIIVVTGNHLYADTQVMTLADMFLVKPVRPTDLVKLADRLSRRSAEQT
jgi:DNA-binding response OmpR family regulator